MIWLVVIAVSAAYNAGYVVGYCKALKEVDSNPSTVNHEADET